MNISNSKATNNIEPCKYAHCGNEFYSNNSRKKYCKDSCKTRAYEKRNNISTPMVNATPEKLEGLKNEFNNITFAIILRSTKDGKFKRSNQYGHNSDIHTQVTDVKQRLKKTGITQQQNMKFLQSINNILIRENK